MLHREQNRKIVKLRFVDGQTVREIAAKLRLTKSAVQRVTARFEQELEIWVGRDGIPRDGRREVVQVLLDRAAKVCQKRSAAPVEDVHSHRRLLTVI